MAHHGRRLDALRLDRLDVRGKDQFELEHIKGAVNYPLTDLETDLEKKTAESKLPRNKFLITYCA